LTSVLVTGASRGIGRATALACARRGLDLGLVGRPSTGLRETSELCLAAGSARVAVFRADFAKCDELAQAAADFLREFGAPAAVLHNAGAVSRTSVEETAPAVWDEQVAVNLTAPFVLTRALLPAMRVQGRGRFVFVASISATLGTARLSAYCATKWGVVGFMKSLAEELSDSGLMACAVLPGSVDTRMLEGSGFRPRMTAEAVAQTLVYYALEAPLAHNGSSIEMFGV
jgi:3-oxoacyl-[acyl-carrier protein] reductase